MQKQVDIVSQGHMVPLGPDMMVRRVIPNHYIQTVGPFVFLDHMGPVPQAPDPTASKRGTGAHPHRGIITFTYLFSGEVEHYDSQGNHSIVKAGGAQWMKSGNGIIHDEGPSAAFQKTGGTLHGLQLWVNLPAAIKAENPEYRAMQNEEVPETKLPDNAGKIRVLMGELGKLQSPLKSYSPLLHFHIHLHPGKRVSLEAISGFEYGVYIASGELNIGGKIIRTGEFATLTEQGEILNLENNKQSDLDIMLYGGTPLHEPMHAEGPFVMNSRAETALAYRDYYAGKYGEIMY